MASGRISAHRSAHDHNLHNEKLDPRCDGSLYADLVEAARLIQCNQYEDARSLIKGAFVFQEDDD
jgi:hypothetical protein